MLVIVIMLYVILSGRDIGEMKTAEIRARETGKLLRDGATPMMGDEATAMPTKDGVTPKARSSGSGGTSILYASSFACIIAALMYKLSGAMKIRESFDVFMKGMAAMLPLAILMVLAFAIGDICDEGNLGTGIYVAETAKDFISPALVPALIFIIACFIAFSTGTSWGTFAIMLGIAIPLANSLDTNLSLAIAAVLGGGIFGDHCSPTSDTSIISSMASASDHIDHVRTQLPYALIGGGITVILYLILGFAEV